MDPKLRSGAALSPIALATILALTAAQTALPTPWFPLSAVEANHCTPACDAPPCDCDTSCYSSDCGSDGYTDLLDEHVQP